MTQSFIKKRNDLFTLIILLSIVGMLEISYIYATKNNTQAAACNGLKQQSQQVQCWAEAIESVIQQRGVNKTFELIPEYFLTKPGFAGMCYEVLHEVGHWTYHHTVENNIKFDMPENVTLCGNGFDRGFIEEL